ncbi:uncharacterized protein METZ01_LOCUS379441, partial [marine metagenome]
HCCLGVVLITVLSMIWLGRLFNQNEMVRI